jgi:hypothetical protein
MDMANEFKDVRNALARAVAEHRVPDEAIDIAAEQIAASKYKIRGLDVCAYGICIDYIINRDEWENVLNDLVLVKGGVVRDIEVFPWGIPFPDILHLKVKQSLDAMPQVRV